jgi:hypothetical protein
MTEIEAKNTRIFIIGITLSVFVVSLTQTALTYNDYDGVKTHSSLTLLLMGGFSILGGGLLEWLVWLANPLYFMSIFFLYKSDKTSVKCSITSTAIASIFTTWKEILAAESGRTAKIQSLDLGYWFWLTSLAILTLGTIYYFRRYQTISQRQKAQHPT